MTQIPMMDADKKADEVTADEPILSAPDDQHDQRSIELENYRHSELTELIIKAFFKVYNTLGYGFLEKVYENAMYIELTEMGFKVDRQKRILVYYNEHVVGDYCSC